jgi:ribonucleoside-diphosphate reductase alpha chain
MTLTVTNDSGSDVESQEEITSQNPYTYDEVFDACLEYFEGDDLAASTWMQKYCLKDNAGNFYEKTPDDMHKRMAYELARMECQLATPMNDVDEEKFSEYYKKRKQLTQQTIYNYFKDFKYIIPQGSIMSMLGNEHQIGSLSNCIVIEPPCDSYGGIGYADQQLAQLMKRRCGVGLDISNLRPSGTEVNNAAKQSTGTVSFMERFSSTTREVAQGGRRGALMITIDVRHPEVQKFSTIKQDLTKVTGANISIRLTDEFMQAVDEDKDFDLRYPIDSDNVIATVKAAELWDVIINSAHASAEPGLIFWDHQHWYSTSSVYPGFENSSTNPCSEIAMQGGDSCRLIVVNFFSFIDKPFTPDASVNYEKLYEVTYEAQRMMDNIVELEIEHIDRIIAKIKNDPEPEHVKRVELETWQLLREQGLKGRRTGLGFTALGDTLAAMNVKIDSDEALELTEKIMKCKCEAEWNSTIDMAIERGAFEAFDPEIEKTSTFIQMLEKELPNVYARNMKYGRRNISNSTVAPTGTVSMMTRTSSGIEPVYMLSYMRRRKVNPNDPEQRVDFTDDLGDEWMNFEVHHPKFKMWQDITGKTEVEDSPYHGCTAPEIDWLKRVELQGVVQKYITHSISSTINLPSDVTIEEVADIYMQSWKKGLKGITVYRDGSRTGVLVSTDSAKKNGCKDVSTVKRPDVLDCDIHYSTIQGDKWVFFVGKLDDQVYEIFGGKRGMVHFPGKYKTGWVKKNGRVDGLRTYDLYLGSMEDEDEQLIIKNLGASFTADAGSYTRIVSTMLRHGVPIKFICEQLHKTSSDADMFTFEKGIARVLKKYIKDGEISADTCPECKQKSLKYEEGCNVCTNCGHSACK